MLVYGRLVPIDLAEQHAGLVGLAVLAEGLEHVEALAARLFLQRPAGVLPDRAVEGGVLAGLQREFDAMATRAVRLPPVFGP